MTFIDIIAALIILGLFLFGFTQALMPAYNAWEKAASELRAAKAIHFIAESFRRECGKPDRNIDNWEMQAAAVKELESYEITELWQGDVFRALKLLFFVSGIRVEVIGLCVP